MLTDVLVIGAGPVGLTAAIELTRFGLSVRILDKSGTRTDKSKALVVWPRTLELLDRPGVTAAMLAAGQKGNAANLMSGAKRLARVTFDDIQSPYPFGLMLPQSDTERVLEEHLATLGTKVERNAELTAFTDSGTSVKATLQFGGQTETVEVAWLIGCDGAHSTVRHHLGLAFEGDTLPNDWLLADIHLEGMPDPGELHISLHRDGALAIFPFGNHELDSADAIPRRARVIANTGIAKEGEIRPDPTLSDVQAVLDTRGPGNVTASDPVWLANFRINERKVKDYRVGRVFLAGDAAHIHSPAGGQGMNTGMQDAINLAWKLALVHRNLIKPAVLDTYTAERSPVAEDVLRATGLMTKAGLMEGPGLQAIRNTAISFLLGLAPIRHTMAAQLAELSIGYPKSPLNFEKSSLRGPLAGERAPVREGELFGTGDTPRFTLCATNDADAQQFIACFPELISPEIHAPYVEGGFWLVRPDGYIAIAAAEGQFAAADQYFANLAVWKTETPVVESQNT